jgi:hypothetical protein
MVRCLGRSHDLPCSIVTHASVFSLGITLLDGLTRDHVFLHDDFDPTYPVTDWEGYDHAPLLLGADVVAFENEQVSDEYLQWLGSIGLGGTISRAVLRDGNASTLCESITRSAMEQSALERLTSNRGVSVFETRVWETDLVRSLPNQPRVIPNRQAFAHLSSKVRARELLSRAGIPQPPGEICKSASDLLSFARHSAHRGDSIIIKFDHRKILLASPSDVPSLESRLGHAEYPLLVERVVSRISSPIVQWIKYSNQSEPLAVSEQRLEGFHHVGNQWPTRVSPQVLALTAAIADLLPPNFGVLGVDFIVTAEGPLVVDLNPRFCASTYPQVAYHRLGFSDEPAMTVRVGAGRDRPMLSIQEVVPLIGRRTAGVLPYCPVERDGLRFWNCLLVGNSDGHLQHLYRAVQRFQAE